MKVGVVRHVVADLSHIRKQINCSLPPVVSDEATLVQEPDAATIVLGSVEAAELTGGVFLRRPLVQFNPETRALSER